MRQDRRPQVLVVDDDADVCALIAEILRHDGYEVVLSSCGEDALRRMVRISGPVVLITNVMLETGMDGLELAYTVRKQWPSPL